MTWCGRELARWSELMGEIRKRPAIGGPVVAPTDQLHLGGTAESFVRVSLVDAPQQLQACPVPPRDVREIILEWAPGLVGERPARVDEGHHKVPLGQGFALKFVADRGATQRMFLVGARRYQLVQRGLTSLLS